MSNVNGKKNLIFVEITALALSNLKVDSSNLVVFFENSNTQKIVKQMITDRNLSTVLFSIIVIVDSFKDQYQSVTNYNTITDSDVHPPLITDGNIVVNYI